MNDQRLPATLVTLVICGLVALGAWTYSSGSASVAGSPVTVAPPPTAKLGTGKPGTGKKPPRVTAPTRTSEAPSTTRAAPVTTVAANPHAYMLALVHDWQHRDRVAANKIAAPAVVNVLFSQVWRASDGWSDKGCQGAAGSSFCTYSRPKRRLVFQVRNATGGLPTFVVALQKLS